MGTHDFLRGFGEVLLILEVPFDFPDGILITGYLHFFEKVYFLCRLFSCVVEPLDPQFVNIPPYTQLSRCFEGLNAIQVPFRAIKETERLDVESYRVEYRDQYTCNLLFGELDIFYPNQAGIKLNPHAH